jgi:hypothetical protein
MSQNESTDADSQTVSAEFEAVSRIMSCLQPLSSRSREKVLRTVATFFAAEGYAPAPSGFRSPSATISPMRDGYSEDRSISPKEFMLQKKPTLDIERVACLAYYLTHYRETPNFKTIDLSKLNTEAAQIKLSNPTQAVKNAARAGLLVPAARGSRQISAGGELFVQALPDREAAKVAMAQFKQRRKSRKKGKALDESEGDEGDEGAE